MPNFDYTTLVTSEHRKSPKFMAMVQYITDVLSELTSDIMQFMPIDFDLDTARGYQLDVIGLWVGCSRRVDVPLNNWFSFDIAGKGFDEGIWRGPFDPPTGLQNLDDTTFRRLIRTVIFANHWDGTLKQYQEILQSFFSDGHVIWAVDNFDMTIDIHVTGTPLSPLIETVLTTGRLAQIKPAGVAIANYVLP